MHFMLTITALSHCAMVYMFSRVRGSICICLVLHVLDTTETLHLHLSEFIELDSCLMAHKR